MPLEDEDLLRILGALEPYGATMELRRIADMRGIPRKTLWEKKKKWGL
jgi:hypothetical protein